jgi:hypothetical protein
MQLWGDKMGQIFIKLFKEAMNHMLKAEMIDHQE